MYGIDIMPAIPNVNIPLGSPHRPTPKFFLETKTFSTKKERENTPRSSAYPKPPIKSCPPISRLFQHTTPDDRPRIVSFKEFKDESLSPTYNSEKKEVYFQQCFYIEKKLGCGSFGDVYQVRSKDDGRQYAVKRSRERFKGELDRRRKLEEVSKHELLPEHPHCVRFYRAWEERQHLYIQTELCESNLAELAESEHEIPERLIWKYLIDLLMAVKHLHDHDLIHMDIKPDNIFIAKDGTCQLGDFGLILDLSKQKSELSDAQEGDPKYLSPELLQGKFTKAADIFSLGITILELASDLDLPRGDEGWHQLRQGKLPENIVKDRMSPELEDVITVMMEPDYTLRPTASAVLNIPTIKRIQRYHSFTRAAGQKSQMVTNSVLALWCYITNILSLFWHLFAPPDKPKKPQKGSMENAASTSEGINTSGDSALNSSWDSSLTYSSVTDDLFGVDDTAKGFLLDDDHMHEDIDMPLPQRALTTGARRHCRRSARIAGLAESPVKTPSQGSPMLPSSTRTRSSEGQPGHRNGPSSTTPPSCRKKMLFDDEDASQQPIGPKNLMAVFDNADSEDEE